MGQGLVSVSVYQRTQNLLRTFWGTQSFPIGLKWGATAECITTAVDKDARVNSTDRIVEHSRKIHDKMRASGLWNGQHNVSFDEIRKEDHGARHLYDTRRLYTELVLAGYIANHLKDVPLPERNIAMKIRVSGQIESAWRTMQSKQPIAVDYGDINNNASDRALYQIACSRWWENALNWDGTTTCVLDAVYKNAKNLAEAIEPGKFKDICVAVHNAMREKMLWGKDATAYAMDFDALSPDKKAHYVLLAAAGLAFLSRSEEG